MEYVLQIENANDAGVASKNKLDFVRKEKGNPDLQIVSSALIHNSRAVQKLGINGETTTIVETLPGFTLTINIA